jgi:hypothetical protein
MSDEAKPFKKWILIVLGLVVTGIVIPIAKDLMFPRVVGLVASPDWNPKPVGGVTYRSFPTAEDIIRDIGSASPLMRDERASAYVGLNVKWKLLLFGIHRGEQGKLNVNLTTDESTGMLVSTTIDPDKYPELRLIEEDTRVWIAGRISKCDSSRIEIAEPQLELGQKVTWFRKHYILMMWEGFCLLAAIYMAYRTWLSYMMYRAVCRDDPTPRSELFKQEEKPPFDQAIYSTKPSPVDILKEISQAPTIHQTSRANEFLSLRVQWKTVLSGASRKDEGVIALDLRSVENGFALVSADIELSQYPLLNTAKDGTKIWIAGTISGIRPVRIIISDPQLSFED